MNAFELASAGISAVGWCLLQFVWQAALVGVVYALARLFLPRGNPRYVAAMLALLLLAACPVFTWHALATARAQASALPEMMVTGPSAASPAPATGWSWRALIQSALPWLVLAWGIGVAALAGRVVRQWRNLRSMLKVAESLPVWQTRARTFAAAMGLRRVVPVLASVRVATPTLIGWVRPAVVMPLAVLARMPATQIDLVLAHELAHLKRLDHIANLFQVVLETLFFYHPVVHWISRDARNERELCCDTLALRVTGGERRDFVAALANLEELRAGRADLALAASGGVLAERAWFIAGAPPKRWHLRSHAILMLAITALVGAGGMWWRDAVWQQRTAALVAASDASVLGIVVRDALQTSLPVFATPAKPRLLPVHYAAASTPAAAITTPIVPIQVAPPRRAELDLAEATLRLAPVATIALPRQPAVSAAPEALHAVPPVYPSEALLNGMQGRVVVEFALDAAGVPRDLEVVDTSGGQFDAAALRALAAWRFAPPAVPGRRYRQAFTFQLGTGTAGNDAAVAHGCLVTTGTHICRPVLDAGTGVRVSRLAH